MKKLKKYINSNLSNYSIKFWDIIYKIGDILLLQVSEENLILELIKIIPLNGIKEYPFWSAVKAKWYYKKKVINRKKQFIELAKYWFNNWIRIISQPLQRYFYFLNQIYINAIFIHMRNMAISRIHRNLSFSLGQY